MKSLVSMAFSVDGESREGTLHVRCVPYESLELFSKPQLTLQPTDVFVGESFRLDCAAAVSATERINVTMLKYAIYKDNVNVTSSKFLVDREYRRKNVNYTCTVQVWNGWRTIVKESRAVVVKVKGEVRETLWCFYFSKVERIFFIHEFGLQRGLFFLDTRSGSGYALPYLCRVDMLMFIPYSVVTVVSETDKVLVAD